MKLKWEEVWSEKSQINYKKLSVEYLRSHKHYLDNHTFISNSWSSNLEMKNNVSTVSEYFLEDS